MYVIKKNMKKRNYQHILARQKNTTNIIASRAINNRPVIVNNGCFSTLDFFFGGAGAEVVQCAIPW